MSKNYAMSEDGRQLLYEDLVSLTDETLMAHLRNGHHDALAVLFDRYRRLVQHIAFGILRDVGESEELVQSVFLEILRSAAQFDRAKGTAKVWILQYAYHRSLNRRQYLAFRSFYANDQKVVSIHVGTSAGHTLDALESARVVQQALRRLNHMQRETLQLSFYEGLRMSEIAEVTGNTLNSIRHHYYRGLLELRRILCEEPRAKTISRGQAFPLRGNRAPAVRGRVVEMP
jgi:RNA polymerase sigma-70 factor (ECF subfamily)